MKVTGGEATVARPAPAGFTAQQWREFDRDGFVAIPDAISPADVASYLDAAQECLVRYPDYQPGHTWKIHDLVREHSSFRELIDHDRHVGYAYDLYGDQLKLVQADLFVRPKQGVINQWHVDGARAVPFRVFSPVLPLKLRIGYWLTDLPRPGMGNLVYLPGSHRSDYPAEHDGIGDLPRQQVLCCRAGTMTIAHASLWHRVQGNDTDQTRINLFLSYAPSWVTGYYTYPQSWLDKLNREQRIILRAYADQENLTRPPTSDLPLFDDPESVVAASANTEPHKIRRWTRYERHLSRL